jgi:hypothetical protein
VASACRLFLGELWYDISQGISYWQQLLGLNNAALNNAALTVPGVVTANTIITSSAGREISGQVQFSTSDGTETSVNF